MWVSESWRSGGGDGTGGVPFYRQRNPSRKHPFPHADRPRVPGDSSCRSWTDSRGG